MMYIAANFFLCYPDKKEELFFHMLRLFHRLLKSHITPEKKLSEEEILKVFISAFNLSAAINDLIVAIALYTEKKIEPDTLDPDHQLIIETIFEKLALLTQNPLSVDERKALLEGAKNSDLIPSVYLPSARSSPRSIKLNKRLPLLARESKQIDKTEILTTLTTPRSRPKRMIFH